MKAWPTLIFMMVTLVIVGCAGLAVDFIGWEWAAGRLKRLFLEMRAKSGV